MRALGIYRESEFSPGKIEADAAILNSALAELKGAAFETHAIAPSRLGSWPGRQVDVVLAMCQGAEALRWLSETEQSGAIVINSPLSIRNCYRDLLNAGLERSGVPTPAGRLVGTSAPLEASSLLGLEMSLPVYLKRGGLHALGAGDVVRAETVQELRAALADFARRGVRQAYVQQAIEGALVKFYGVTGGEFFQALPTKAPLPSDLERALARAGAAAASAIGLEAWGGDAVIDSSGRFKVIDFNDWPSFGRVREQAARAIARRALWLLQRAHLNASRAGFP